MKKLLVLLFAVTILFGYQSKASSILVGEISWSVVGKDSFLIKMVLYRDCNGDEFDTMKLKVFCNSSGQLIKTLVMNQQSVTDITPMCTSINPDLCSRCSDSSCSFPYGFEQYTFTKLLVFDSSFSCCSIKLVYESCCRSLNITNGGLGTDFYTYAIFNRCLSLPDNSLQFNTTSMSMIPTNQEAFLNFSGSDIDKDSSGFPLDSSVFELSSPLRNGTNVQYVPEFEFYKPLMFDGFPDTVLFLPQGFHLNSQQGTLQFTPMQTESTIFAVKVMQYRDGQQVSEILRNYYLQMYKAPGNLTPELSADAYYKEVIADSTVSFSISTFDADTIDVLTLNWNPGFPYGNWTTNSGIPGVKHPIATIEWTPAKIYISEFPYKFTVTVKDNVCPISASYTKEFEIIVKELVGIGEPEDLQIQLYPNPLDQNELLNINVDLNGTTILVIRDVQGKTMIKKKVQTKNFQIDLNGLSEGLYLLELSNGNKIYRRKLMVR